MTKKTTSKNITFSFRAAVREACAHYPRETKNITFIDMATPDALDKFVVAFNKCGEQNRKIALKNAQADSPAEFFEIVRTIAGPAIFSDDITGRRIIMIDTKNEYSKWLFPAQFIFDHELGHAVVPESCPSPRINKKIIDTFRHQAENMLISAFSRAETAADVFAALHALRRGEMDADDIEELSLLRAKKAVKKDITHMTTQGLDALLTDNSFAFLSHLSPREITIYAERIADDYAVKANDVLDVRAIYIWLHETTVDKFAKEATSRLSRNVHEGSQMTRASEYYASRILRHAFETAGLDYPGQLAGEMDGKYWDFKFECLRNNVEYMGRKGALLMPRKNP